MSTKKIIVFVMAFISSTFAINGNDNERRQRQTLDETMNRNMDTPKLNMTLCVDKCAGGDCKTYITPIDECYSSSFLFPGDPSWSGKDLVDAIDCDTQTLVRTIFDTENSTCLGNEDRFLIPLNECVGPFGKPRPWGIFGVMQGRNEQLRKIYDSGLSSLCGINATSS